MDKANQETQLVQALSRIDEQARLLSGYRERWEGMAQLLLVVLPKLTRLLPEHEQSALESLLLDAQGSYEELDVVRRERWAFWLALRGAMNDPEAHCKSRTDILSQLKTV